MVQTENHKELQIQYQYHSMAQRLGTPAVEEVIILESFKYAVPLSHFLKVIDNTLLIYYLFKFFTA